MTARSWGRWPRHRAASELRLVDRSRPLPPARGHGLLAHGLGRSYGDVGLNEAGTLLLTRGLDRFIAFDRAAGVLRAEAGVSLDEILRLVVPVGWFLAVSPGTRFVTLGGAVANDVHGKNHHQAGTFGCHVRAFELLRSDGSRLVCTPDQNADWFAASIGGLGLTGLLTWVEIQLVPIANPNLWVVNRRFRDLTEYWQLDAELGPAHAYSVAWVDCLGGGRGIYSAADFAGVLPNALPGRPATRRMPIDPPFSLINGLSLRVLNTAYYRRPIQAQGWQHFETFFYPLDAVRDWNRVYGRGGFYQYQCVLPTASMREAAAALFRRIERSDQGSILAVFKTFGERRSPGLLSFPRPGATLALDFPNRGAPTLALFRDLDVVVAAAGGALYPAKDARMPAALFQSGYAGLEAFTRFVDPAFSSSLWRRVATAARRLTTSRGSMSMQSSGQRIVVFGATSAIAHAAARIWVQRGAQLVLVGRNPAKLEGVAADLRVRAGAGGAARVHAVQADLDDLDRHGALIDAAIAGMGGIDLALIAHGSLPDQRACEADPGLGLREMHTNATSAIHLAAQLATRMAAQRRGTIAAISSVAGDRGRQSNYVYGASKGMLTLYLQGLRNHLHVHGVQVLTIKPGFVDTPMTAGVAGKGALWATPEQVARGIARAVDRRRDVVYLPGFWRPIMAVVRAVPEALFKRLEL